MQENTHEVHIVVERGMVTEVFASTPDLVVTILDTDVQEPEERDFIDAELDNVHFRADSGELFEVY